MQNQVLKIIYCCTSHALQFALKHIGVLFGINKLLIYARGPHECLSSWEIDPASLQSAVLDPSTAYRSYLLSQLRQHSEGILFAVAGKVLSEPAHVPTQGALPVTASRMESIRKGKKKTR